jgi:hypothetical protein
VKALQLTALDLCSLPRDQWQIRVRATQITTNKLATDNNVASRLTRRSVRDHFVGACWMQHPARGDEGRGFDWRPMSSHRQPFESW